MTDYKASEQDAIKFDMLSGHIRGTNVEIVNAFNDAICNLLLFASTVAPGKGTVVVAFGAEHLTPLRALLLSLQQPK
jgi:hypothetical protein